MDPKLADLLLQAGIATDEQADKLRRLIQEDQADRWAGTYPENWPAIWQAEQS